MYKTAKRVTGVIARQLRDLKTIGAISALIYGKAMKNANYAKKVIQSNKGQTKRGPRKIKTSGYKELKTKVRELSKYMEQEMATHIRRERNTARVLSAVNAVTQQAFAEGGTVTAIEAAMSSMRYFDSATNALVVANPATGTYNRDILVSIAKKICLRNNYQVPCKLRVYACVPKQDTSISTTGAFTNGMTDQGAPLITSPLVYLTDSEQFGYLWKIENSKEVVLYPGQEYTASHYFKPFTFDFDIIDSHALAYQRKFGGFNWVVRIEGILGHDSVLDEQGTLQGGVDVNMDITYKMEYDAGKDLHDISIVNNSDAFTNGGLVSNQPVADNQGYSVA